MYILELGARVKKQPVKISIIVPNWNGSLFLFELFASLEKYTQDSDCEIIVVDNGSKDGSIEQIRCFYPETKLIELDSNQGFAVAVNHGFRPSEGEYIAIINNDVSWGNDWLKTCADFLDSNPEYDYAAPLVMNYFQRNTIDSAGDAVNKRFMPYKKYFGKDRKDAHHFDRDLYATSCSAVLLRRSFFDRVGGFDEDFFMYYEDVDLFFRGFLKGSRGRLMPEEVVFHREGGSISRLEREQKKLECAYNKTCLLIRNRVYFLLKNCPAGYLLLAWPLLLLEWFRSLLYHLLKGQIRVFIRAHVSVLPKVSRMLRKRRLIQKHKKVSVFDLFRTLE